MALWQFGGGGEQPGRAMVLAEGLLNGPPSQKGLKDPFGIKFGICGVGLFGESQNTLRAAIFIDNSSQTKPLEAHPLYDFPSCRDALGTTFGGDRTWLERDVVVVPVPKSIAQIAPGEYVRAGASGQLGCPVKWGSTPSQGVLTAGHVGIYSGSLAYDSAGALVGAVKFVLNPAPGSGAAEIDVAVIELTTGISLKIGPSITGSAIPPPGAAIEVHVQQSRAPSVKTTNVYGNASWWHATLSNVTYSDVYISGGVTQPGDSGGPVFLGGAAGQIIGHIVCGSPGHVSCIQDIQQQLKAISNDPAFSAIRI
jgi:hypothetical protein